MRENVKAESLTLVNSAGRNRPVLPMMLRNDELVEVGEQGAFLTSRGFVSGVVKFGEEFLTSFYRGKSAYIPSQNTHLEGRDDRVR